jgi:hypothetical protein
MMMSIWKSWTYADYRKSVERNVTKGVEELGFDVSGAIGYANDALLLRLDEFPAENVLAVTALAIAANQRGTLASYENEDEFRQEIAQAYANGEHLVIANNLEKKKKQEFLRDVGIVSNVLGISLKQPA